MSTGEQPNETPNEGRKQEPLRPKNIIEALEAQWAELDALAVRGATATSVFDSSLLRLLFDAARNGGTGLIKKILASGVDPNSKDANGQVPLMYAAKGGHLDSLIALLDNGADLNVRDSSGRTAAEWAAANGHHDVADALRDKSAD